MSKVVRSFENSSDDIYGDILSKKKSRRKVKIGLLTCGYFEYWRMYPQTLKSNVEKDLKTVEDRFIKEFKNVVCSGMVDTLDSADMAGKMFKKEEIDLLVVVEGTYVPDYLTLHVINYVKNIPIVFFSTQLSDSIDPKGDYEHSLRNSGLIGVAQITGTFCKMNKKYKVVVGSINDDRAYEKIRSIIQAVQAVLDISEANIGVVGHVFRGMYDLELSKTFLKSTFDVNVIYIQSSHLLDIWNNVTDKESAAIVTRSQERFLVKGSINKDDIFRSAKLAVAMKKLVKKYNLDAMCFLDQHFVQKQFHTTARMGASLLMEEDDISTSCEGDLGGLLMMMCMRSISGEHPLMGEWGEYDAPSNSCLIMGHGIGVPGLAVSDNEISLTRTPEEWGFSGAGLNYEFIVKPGDATIGHFLETMNGYKILISPVKSISYAKLEYDEIHAMVRVKQPVKEYLEKLLENGVTHHCILGLSSMGDTLINLAWLLDLEKIYIE